MPDVSPSNTGLETKVEVNSAWTIASVVVASGVALFALYTGPLLLGEYMSRLAISESQAGFIISMEMAGLTLGSVIFFAISHLNWRRILTVSLLLMVAANVALLVVEHLPAFVGCRFIAGLGSGMVMTLTIQVVGMMRDPDRIYGMWTLGQLALGTLGLLLFPTVIESGSLNTVFVIWALMAFILLPSIRFYPCARVVDASTTSSQAGRRRLILGMLCLGGLFVYYGGQAGVWVFLERLGVSWGIAGDSVAQILFLSLLAAIAGAVVAIFLGHSLGRVLPLSISMGLSATSILFLIFSSGVSMFTFAACLFNFAWYLFLPYMSAIVAVLDQNGRLLTGLAVTFPAGLAAGPAVAALLIGSSESLLACLVYGLLSVPIGLALILPGARFRASQS